MDEKWVIIPTHTHRTMVGGVKAWRNSRVFKESHQDAGMGGSARPHTRASKWAVRELVYASGSSFFSSKNWFPNNDLMETVFKLH